MPDVSTAAPAAPIASTDRAFFGHPRGLGLLAAAEMWERFSYYGMRAILVLYLTKALGWNAQDATRLYGAYTGAVYLTPMVGGYLADRYIGTRRSLVIGGIIIAIGHFLLAIEGMTFFYAGLIAVVIGTGFFKPNVSTMVGQLYGRDDARRDAGFTIFYSCFNFGAFLAPLVCGFLAEDERFGWHLGFGAAGVGMVLGLIVYLVGRDRYLPGIGLAPEHTRDAETNAEIAEIGIPSYGRNAALGATGGVIVATLASYASWSSIGVSAWLFSLSGLMSLMFGIIIGGAFTVALLGTQGEERNRVWALVLVSFFVVFFWLVFEQAGSSLTLFADRDVDLTRGASLFGLDRIPASWYASVQPLCIILLGPFAGWFWFALNRRGLEPPTLMKMVLGLFMAGFGFFLLYFAGRDVDAGFKVSPLWLIGAYLFHSFGEIALYPVGLSYVTKVAPAQFVSLLMGTFFLAISAANFLGGFMAGLIDSIPSRATFFTIPTATAWGAGVLMLLCVPLLKRLTRSVAGA